MIIGIDIDSTIVDTITPWANWYTFHTGEKLNFSENKNIYELMTCHSSPLDFWKQPNLYDNLTPYKKCVKVIKQLMEKHEVIFISYCFAGHLDSKVSFLKRNFGHNIKFIDTEHKEYIKLDVAIDDRGRYLRKIKEAQPNCRCIQKKSLLNCISFSDHFEDWDTFIEDFPELF